eukprot:TRINITY_DN6720_c0_g2_i1.p2 TRINITY_DN6720_c0_g2~~TRINITY_DN6720_c0_g2_i1.p2  ORF type:complete len:127 (-),score=10.04 TRINITY_DN6720_c0_g2_i1:1-381(-)
MGSKQDIQDWNLGLSQLLPRIYNVCSTYTNFKLSLVSQSLKAGFEDMLPVYQFKLKQNADDKEIQAMLWASNFKKDDRKKNCKEIADELRVSEAPNAQQHHACLQLQPKTVYEGRKKKKKLGRTHI